MCPWLTATRRRKAGSPTQHREDHLEVECLPQLLEVVPPHQREALLGVLAQDPRPSYQNDPQRVYGMGFWWGRGEVHCGGQGPLGEIH